MDRVKGLNQETKQGSIIFLFSFLFYAFVMYCAPFSSDDLEHIIYKRTDFDTALQYVLYYGNGRLLGNLGTIYLCNYMVPRVLCKALALALMAVLLPTALKVYSPRMHLLSFLLVTCMSGTLFSQVFTWTSGFTNYIPPIVFCLAVVCLLNSCDRWNGKLKYLFGVGAIFCFGIASQLYNEIATIFNCMLSVVLLAVAIKGKRKKAGHLMFTLASFFGAVIMYLIPVLFYVENNRSDGYRSVAMGSVKTLVMSVVTHGCRISGFIAENLVFCLFLCFCAYHILLRGDLPGRFRTIVGAARKLIVVAATYFLCNCFVNNGIWYGHLKPIRDLFSVVFILIPCGSLFVGIMLSPVIKHRTQFFILFALSALVILPLLIVNPISMRCIVQFYIIQTAIGLLYFAKYVKIPEINSRTVNKTLCVAVVSISVVITMAFVNIRWLSNTRDQYISHKMEQGATEIVIFPIPYDYVFWDGTAAYPYMYHYTEPGDIEFTAIYYEDWSWMYGEEIIAEGD